MSATPAIPAILPLEDGFTDVLGKARKGLKLTLEEMAERAGLSLSQVEQVLNGQVDNHALEKLAFVLGLHGPSLIALARNEWQPQVLPEIPGLRQFTTWYGDMTVNAYLVWDPNTGEACSFDTGSSCQPMLDFLQTNDLGLQKICITHTHMDHLADLERLAAEFPQAHCYGSAAENPLGLKPLVGGDGLCVGNLKIRVLGTSGHTPGGLSYFIEGLQRPLVVVGDALFSASMGGAPYAYHEARQNNLEQLLSLPDNTIICPGHGPLTTVGQEKAHNPFFPELK
ncbi:MBL fold metallo-hydrolase [Vampirovibrio sp.]|uniref:MBL fold metallo-hydrolase n=1 Tax=Vampirovibrio sp. TaxID=2717857 RepID=UPI00359312C4